MEAKEFDSAIAWLRTQGMQALVLDLRNNPGGVLDSSLAIANRFIPKGVLVTTASRDGTAATLAKEERCTLEGLPLVVLVGSSSASASEVLAGALQDHRAGALVGNSTYGKGAVQTLARYDGLNAIVKLTTSYYMTPAERVIERGLTGPEEAGLAPDLNVELSAEERDALHEFLASYGPPPSARTALEAWEQESGEQLMARAPDDPQLQAAVGLLTGSITPRTP